jgi:hypothetical protein
MSLVMAYNLIYVGAEMALVLCTKRQQLLDTSKTILEPPKLSTGRGYKEEEPSTIEEFQGLLCRFDRSDFGVGKRRDPFRHRIPSLFWGIYIGKMTNYP